MAKKSKIKFSYVYERYTIISNDNQVLGYDMTTRSGMPYIAALGYLYIDLSTHWIYALYVHSISSRM